MRVALAFTVCLFLSACAAFAPHADEKNFVVSKTTRLNFDEAQTVCRSRTNDYRWMGLTNTLDVPRFKECMAAQGYSFKETK